MSEQGAAAARWRSALEAWAIPPAILAAAPESPWTFPTELFARRADASSGSLTASNSRALEALPDGGGVVDVGCGAGAASLPLAGRAALITGVDSSNDMLAAFAERVGRTGARAATVPGTWPERAPETPRADVVVCHHVFYNVPDLTGFALALTDHARARVVAEMTLEHPQAGLSDLWLSFHGVRRPTGPGAEDAVKVLREAGLAPGMEVWQPEVRGGFADRADLVAWIRRRLCLPGDRDEEVEDAIYGRLMQLGGLWTLPPSPVATLWWDGSAG